MADKAISSVVNLLQRATIAVTEGKADATIEYVPVSKTPYLKAWIEGGFDAGEDMRTRLVLALVERGFKRRGDAVLEQQTDRGYVTLRLEGPHYDDIKRMPLVQVHPYGPYDTPDASDIVRRDVPTERARYVATQRQADHDRFMRHQGSSNVISNLLRRAPFPIPFDDSYKITNSDSMAVAYRVAGAFASQKLRSFEDLVEQADLGELLGRKPAPAPEPEADQEPAGPRM